MIQENIKHVIKKLYLIFNSSFEIKIWKILSEINKQDFSVPYKYVNYLFVNEFIYYSFINSQSDESIESGATF